MNIFCSHLKTSSGSVAARKKRLKKKQPKSSMSAKIKLLSRKILMFWTLGSPLEFSHFPFLGGLKKYRLVLYNTCKKKNSGVIDN